MDKMRFQMTIRRQDNPELFDLLNNMNSTGRSETGKRLMTLGLAMEKGSFAFNNNQSSNAFESNSYSNQDDDLLGSDLDELDLM